MTDIERHIVALLLDNDCVIVPGFGGFMAHSIAASYREKDNIFIPPSRTIGFNPLLTMNDSLLAQAYANCYDISYPEALRRIEHDVEYLKRQIESEGGHTICGVGRIVMSEDGKYGFIPDISGLSTPNLYGFEPFEINVLKAEEADMCENKVCEKHEIIEEPAFSTNRIFTSGAPIITPVKHEEAIERKRKEIAVHIPIGVIKHIAAACIILFIMLAIPSKLGNASTSTFHKSSIDTSLFYEIMPKEITSGMPDSLSMIPQVKVDFGVNNENQNQTSDIVRPSDKPYFSIVLASRITRKNAETYVERLHKKGLVDASVHTYNGITKVIYKSFKTHKEASDAMKALNSKGEFADCWITVVR